MSEVRYKRILLKVSGEALAGDKHHGLDFDVIGQVCDVIVKCVKMSVAYRDFAGRRSIWRGNGEVGKLRLGGCNS